jgi:hypothetical protein
MSHDTRDPILAKSPTHQLHPIIPLECRPKDIEGIPKMKLPRFAAGESLGITVASQLNHQFIRHQRIK